MLLSDHGAQVTKVERPGGDPYRSMPGSQVWLRGRRSVELDLTDQADLEVARRLIDAADVVIDSTDLDTARQRGLDPESTRSRNPRLVHCRITAYGDRGAWRDRPAIEALVMARTGLQWVNRGNYKGAGRAGGGEDFLPDFPIPEGMEPGSPREGPIFNYSPWLLPRGCDARRRRHQRRAAGSRNHWPRAVGGDVAAAGGDGVHHCEVAAGRGAGHPVVPELDLRPACAQGIFPVLRRALGAAVGAQPQFRAVQRRRRRACDASRRREDEGRPGPHFTGSGKPGGARALPPADGGGDREVPVDRLDAGGRSGGRSAAAGPHTGGGAGRRGADFGRRCRHCRTRSTVRCARPAFCTTSTTRPAGCRVRCR